ncbi:unnamed protein product [Adineta ricciae]|uniref:Uncharacterized protein n=1 Tax=Adineta ricciae TaxID=249248 RepID=A0A815D9K4_ADIRI|nr:unnamed protein product [Adineta ricciae]
MGSKSSKPIATESTASLSYPKDSADVTSTNTQQETAPVTTSSTPTREITSTSSLSNDTVTTSKTLDNTSKLTLHSVATSLISNDENTSKQPAVRSAATRWYNWTKFEQQKRVKGKILWYMNSPATKKDAEATPIEQITPTTTALTPTTAPLAKVDESEKKEESKNDNDITVVPTYQLRTTTVHSPPGIERIPSPRRELTNTDVSNFKYYRPDERSRQPVGTHTKATMYRMNTILRQVPSPAQLSSPESTNPGDVTNITTRSVEDLSKIRTYVSRGLQTDLEVQPSNSSDSLVRYYEKQQSQFVPFSTLTNYASDNNGFYNLESRNTNYESTLPPIGEPSESNGYPSQSKSPPSNPSAPISILKKTSTGLSRDASNPFSEQAHEKMVEELRKRDKNLQDGTYRVKKVHLLEKNDPPPEPRTVTFRLPTSKANQSIQRSEKLFSSN